MSDLSRLQSTSLLSETFKQFGKGLIDSFRYIPPTLRLAWRSSKNSCVTIGLLTLLLSVSPLAIAYVGKFLIDAVVLGETDAALRFVLLELFLVLVLTATQRGLSLTKSVFGAKLSSDVNIAILEKAIQLPYPDFEDPTFYDQMTRARREASSRPLNMFNDVVLLIQNLITLIGYTSILLTFSAWSVVLLLLSTLPATLAESRFSMSAFRIRNFRSPDTRRLNYLEYVLATDSYAKEVKTFQLGSYLLDRYKKLTLQFFKEDKKLSIERASWALGLSLLAIFAFYSCYYVLAEKSAKGLISVGLLTLYIASLRQGQQTFQNCLSSIGNMYEHNLYMSNLLNFLSAPLESSTETSSRPLLRKEKGIRLENVSYRYPGGNHWALKDISLNIPSGQSLGIVGHNGAGKTTLIKLLTRLYKPTEGKVLLDGVDLLDWDSKELHARMGVVFQDFNKYQFSLAENIGLGHLDKLEAKEDLLKAAQKSGASSFLDNLPQGLQTQLGRWFLDGTELSQGEWQRVALARAFVREEADILILDEPTSAFDPLSEEALLTHLVEVSKGKTLILISHRFPTVRIADKIILLEKGQIQEEGSHEFLLDQGKEYARMFTAQAKGYH